MRVLIIKKEIWLDLEGKVKNKRDTLKYPVFFLYNHVDRSTAYSPCAGCRVNKVPFLKLEAALALAKAHEMEALASRKWVRAVIF